MALGLEEPREVVVLLEVVDRVPVSEELWSDHCDLETEPFAECSSLMPPLLDHGPLPFMVELLDMEASTTVSPVRCVVVEEELDVVVIVPIPDDWCELEYCASVTPPSMELDDEESPEYVPIPLLLVLDEKVMRDTASEELVRPLALNDSEFCEVFEPEK